MREKQQLQSGRLEQSQSPKRKLDALDLRIERAETDPKDGFYTAGVLAILNMIRRSKKFQRPHGKNMPIFSEEEVKVIADMLFFKPPTIKLRVMKRVHKEKELPLRRRAFVKYLFDNASFNRAKAARMAGYSARSAKQIAYNLIHS